MHGIFARLHASLNDHCKIIDLFQCQFYTAVPYYAHSRTVWAPDHGWISSLFDEWQYFLFSNTNGIPRRVTIYL